MNLFGYTITKRNDSPYRNATLSEKDLYAKLRDYYSNNGLYDGAMTSAYYNGTWVEAMKPLRTAVNRSVEFYANKVCPNKVRVISENQSVKDAIEQFHKWSNFESQKKVSVRDLALLGNLFWKIVIKEDKIYFEVIEPENVKDFKTDYRGYITEILICVPQMVNGTKLTYVEYWTKENGNDGYLATWMTTTPPENIEGMGVPETYIELKQLGIDFIPIVHVKFRDTGKKLGVSCVLHSLDKIDEANREATRISQLLFRYNKPIWAVRANTVDKDNRPLPAPKIKSGNTNQEDLELKDNSIVYLPGNSSMESLIPDINYADALSILKDMMDEIEKDLPELRYYSIQEGNLSGKAIKLLLAGAVDKATEAQTNFIEGLERLDEMALTIGQFMGFFFNIGSYENGDFEHDIDAGEMFPQSEDEKATTLKTFVEAGLPLASALRISGYAEEEIAKIVEEKQTQDTLSSNSLANSLMKFNQG